MVSDSDGGIVSHRSPLSLSSIMNKELSASILGSKDFVWNLTLTFAFGWELEKRGSR